MTYLSNPMRESNAPQRFLSEGDAAQKRSDKMRAESKDNQTDGYEMLKGLLTGLQSKAQRRIKTLRKDQEQDTDSGPADAMDSANSTEDVEIHAGLIAREEEKLIGLDEALARVEAGKYGKCLKCHETIPFERLMAVP